MDDQSPPPDAHLARIIVEEHREERGKEESFFGGKEESFFDAVPVPLVMDEDRLRLIAQIDRHPSEITPALTEARLQIIAATIIRVRSEARDGHLPEKGDDAWVFGCRAYRRTCFALKALQVSGECLWLEVVESGLGCTLRIDGEPLKFYRGDPKKPPTRMMSQLSFWGDETEGWLWLIAITAHEDGSVARIALVQARHHETRNLYYIEPPPGGAVRVLSALGPIDVDGVELERPLVTPIVVEPEQQMTADGSFSTARDDHESESPR
jgi:hypothetical protein